MKILVLLSRFPYPLEKGDKLRAYNHIKYLSVKNEIILCSINVPGSSKFRVSGSGFKSKLEPYCKAIEVINFSWFTVILNLIRGIFTDKPLQVEYFYNKKAQKRIDNLINQHKPDHILCQLIRVAEYVKNKDIPKTLDYQDVFSKGIERRINISQFYTNWFLNLEYKRLLKYEKDIFKYFDNKIIISKSDRDYIPHEEREKIFVIPNGVDTGYYKLLNHALQTRACKYDLVFTGNMGYYPNIVSALFLAKEILPRLEQYNPEIKLLIAGANPVRKIRALQSDKITVSGWVDDIRECYAESKIFIAPMQIGTGLQNKLLEAMAMRLPCITSALANVALGAKQGKEIIVCNTAEDYVKNILELLKNEERMSEIAENGYNFVLMNYNWSKLTEKLQLIMC